MCSEVELIRLRAENKTLLEELEHQINLSKVGGTPDYLLDRPRELVKRIKERHNGLEVDAD